MHSHQPSGYVRCPGTGAAMSSRAWARSLQSGLCGCSRPTDLRAKRVRRGYHAPGATLIPARRYGAQGGPRRAPAVGLAHARAQAVARQAPAVRRPASEAPECRCRQPCRSCLFHTLLSDDLQTALQRASALHHQPKKPLSSSRRYFLAARSLSPIPMPGRSHTSMKPSLTIGSGSQSTMSYHHSGWPMGYSKAM